MKMIRRRALKKSHKKTRANDPGFEMRSKQVLHFDHFDGFHSTIFFETDIVNTCIQI
ncbi:MAG: hypothetical protein RLZ93_1320 [Bacteroidota bacterium]